MNGTSEFHAPRHGSLDLTRLIQRGTLVRARDLRMFSGGFLAGVLSAVAVAVLAVSWRVVT